MTEHDVLKRKKETLARLLDGVDSLLVAFSGGLDSAFLLAVAHDVLGPRVAAATAVSAIHPDCEKEAAKGFARQRGIEHILIQSKELGLAPFLANPPDRCYHCKQSLFGQMLAVAKEMGIASVAHGANADDPKDFRPGLQAAQEAGVWAPLMEAGLGKAEIRLLSKAMGLPTWDKPSTACLATRIPYGSPITLEKLEMIEKAEAFLVGKGIRQCRVRHHGSVARIELERDGAGRIMEKDLREAVVGRFRQIGFVHIALDLEEYESGRMNRGLAKVEAKET